MSRTDQLGLSDLLFEMVLDLVRANILDQTRQDGCPPKNWRRRGRIVVGDILRRVVAKNAVQVLTDADPESTVVH